MTLLLKDPGSVLDYAIDWGSDYLIDDVLADSSWTVQPDEADGVQVQASAFDSTTATVTAAGGIPGHIYQLTNQVELASGLTDSRSVRLDKVLTVAAVQQEVQKWVIQMHRF